MKGHVHEISVNLSSKSRSSSSNGLRRRTLAVLFAGVVTAGTGIAAGASLAAASAAAAPPPTATPTTTHTAKTIPTPPALVTPNAWTLGSLPPPTFAHERADLRRHLRDVVVLRGGRQRDRPSWAGDCPPRRAVERLDLEHRHQPQRHVACENQLYGVSCVGPSFCVAVGVCGPGGTFVDPLVEQWNGTVWSLVAASRPPSFASTELNAVSCTTTTWCMAVGYSTNGSSARIAVAETWNGTAWTVSSINPPTGALASQLDGIDCVSTSWCMAGGDYENTSRDFLSLATLWNGSAWSAVPSPNPGAGTSGFFDSVSCAGTQFCVAAGYYYDGTFFQAELAKWNGSTWSNVTVPEANPSTYNYLDAAACISATSCSAVGKAGDPSSSSVALTWNGQTWSIVTAPARRVPLPPDSMPSPASRGGSAWRSERSTPHPFSPMSSPPRSPARATASSPATAASSTTAPVHPSSARWAASTSTSPSSGWESCRPVTGTTWWPPTAGSSPTARPSSTDRPAACT